MRAKSGDEASRRRGLAEMVRLHQGALWRYLRYLGCEAQLADDLVQETFLAVWRRPFDVRSEGATRRYLRTVARNLFLMHVRRRKATPAFRDLDAADAVWVEEADDGGEAYREALRTCLEHVSPKSRTALTLTYREGASRKAIATRLGMRPDGVKTLLRRVRAALRECIERRLSR